MHNIPLPIQLYVPLLLSVLCGGLATLLLARSRAHRHRGQSRP